MKRIALSHDWLNGMRGGEKCLEVLCELYPDSDIFTLFHERGKVSETIARHPIHVSRVQNFPGATQWYRYYLPLFPVSIEAFDLKGYDLVISTSHCVAKGIKKAAGAVHISYCFTPMRYAWALFDDYFGRQDGFSRAGINFFMNKLKDWDLKSNERVDHFVAISEHVRQRIKRFYQREAEVIYPPVDTDFYTPGQSSEKEDFYLIVSALVPYKKIDAAIEAFNRLGKKLVIIGAGPEMGRLRKLAKRNVQFLGWQSDEALRNYYRKTKALIFPGEEDFGIVPVEIQACGGFVIALCKGGALETVNEGKTGLFFDGADNSSLDVAVERFEAGRWDGNQARQNALRFGRERFKKEMKQIVDRVLA